MKTTRYNHPKRTARSLVLSLFALLFFAGIAVAQDIPQSQVPSVVVNAFQKSFPKVYDVEWERDGNYYKVEFETGLIGLDHDVWYDETGKMIRHKEEISRRDLPQAVTAAINRDFAGYRVDDVAKITEGDAVTYTLEVKKAYEEWKVAIDAGGNVLHKMAD